MCPLLDKTDSRCGRYLTLDNLAQAMELCAERYGQCPIRREILRDAQGQDGRRDRTLLRNGSTRRRELVPTAI